jgi:DNA-binding NarL/FixJ family response regulator
MKVLLADDHTLFREGMEMIIKNVLPTACIISANNWKEAHYYIQNEPFDIALLDLFMPRDRLWEDELASILKYAPDLAVCIISASTVHSHVQTALKLGARGFIHKTAGIVEIQQALLQIQQGHYYLPDVHQKNTHTKASIGKITHRQREVLALLIDGKSNKEIGLQLNIAETTVKRHVYNIFQTLKVNNRINLSKIVKEQGILGR